MRIDGVRQGAIYDGNEQYLTLVRSILRRAMCAARCGAYGDVLTSHMGSPRVSAPHSVAFVPYLDMFTPYSVTFFSYSDTLVPSSWVPLPWLLSFRLLECSLALSRRCPNSIHGLALRWPLPPALCRAFPRLRQMPQAQNRRDFQRWLSQPRQQVRRRWCF